MVPKWDFSAIKCAQRWDKKSTNSEPDEEVDAGWGENYVCGGSLLKGFVCGV